MTLIETMTALALLSIVLTLLFGFFKQLSDLQLLTENQQRTSFQMRYAESRLSYIFQRLIKDSDNYYNEKFYFYLDPSNNNFSQYPSLVFTFNNGVKRDPTLSDELLARLYIDENQSLCLVTWPVYDKDARDHMHKEILLNNIKNIEYEFYMPPEKDKKNNVSAKHVDPEEKLPENNKWHQEWKKTYKQLPAILRITVKFSYENTMFSKKEDKVVDKKITYAFVLPSYKNFVYFPREQE